MFSIDPSLARRPHAGSAKVDTVKDDCDRGKPTVVEKGSGSAALGRSRRVPGECRWKQRHAPEKSGPRLVAPGVNTVGAATLGGDGGTAPPGSVDGLRDEPGGSFRAREADAPRTAIEQQLRPGTHGYDSGEEGREAGALSGNNPKGVVVAEKTPVRGGVAEGVGRRSTQESIFACDAACARLDSRRGVRVNPRGGGRGRGGGSEARVEPESRKKSDDRTRRYVKSVAC